MAEEHMVVESRAGASEQLLRPLCSRSCAVSRRASSVEARRLAAMPDPGEAVQVVAVDDVGVPLVAAQEARGHRLLTDRMLPDRMLRLAGAQEARGRG